MELHANRQKYKLKYINPCRTLQEEEVKMKVLLCMEEFN